MGKVLKGGSFGQPTGFNETVKNYKSTTNQILDKQIMR